MSNLSNFLSFAKNFKFHAFQIIFHFGENEKSRYSESSRVTIDRYFSDRKSRERVFQFILHTEIEANYH